MDVLIAHPYFGSIWLRNATINNYYVVGETDDWQSSPLLPDPQPINIPATMNFPVSCIKKVEI